MAKLNAVQRPCTTVFLVISSRTGRHIRNTHTFRPNASRGAPRFENSMKSVTTAYGVGEFTNMTALTSYAGNQRPRQAILGQLPRIYRADGSPIRVLLVDDEPALTNLVKMALHYEGWDVEI